MKMEVKLSLFVNRQMSQLKRLENELDEESINEYDDVNPSKTIH